MKVFATPLSKESLIREDEKLTFVENLVNIREEFTFEGMIIPRKINGSDVKLCLYFPKE